MVRTAVSTCTHPVRTSYIFYKIKTKGNDDIGQCGMVWSSRFQGGV